MLARTLNLTSPPLVGADVLELEGQLQRAGWLHHRPDGVYREDDAQAVYRAKFWLGYAQPDHRAGLPLQRFLVGDVTPSAEMAARRKKRMHAAAKTPLNRGETVVAKALAELGVRESPAGTNRVKYGFWYGMNGQPWCAMFITWVYTTAGLQGATFRRGSRYAFVPFVVHDARAGRNGLMVHPRPEDGILACYDWQRDGNADHIGICATEPTLRRLKPSALAEARLAFGPLGGGDFWAIEGNTAVGNDSNGGQVMLRKRNLRQVQQFARVAASA